MQQRRQLQTPGGKVNNDLCQPRSVRGKGANFHVECRGLFVVELLGLQLLQSNVNCQNFRSTVSFEIVVQMKLFCKQTPIGQRWTHPSSNKSSFLGQIAWRCWQGGKVCKRKHVATCKHFHSCKIWLFWLAKNTQKFLKISPKNVWHIFCVVVLYTGSQRNRAFFNVKLAPKAKHSTQNRQPNCLESCSKISQKKFEKSLKKQLTIYVRCVRISRLSARQRHWCGRKEHWQLHITI